MNSNTRNLRQRNIRQKVVRHMKALGVYKADYGTTIDIYSDLLYQYELFMKEFEKSGFKIEEEYTNKAGATNMRKTPLLTAIEKLRVDISTYSNMLCLNPKSYQNITAEIKEESKLDKLLGEL